VGGYKEKGNINTPMEIAINNEIDRFTLAIEVIIRTPKVQRIGLTGGRNTAIFRSIGATRHRARDRQSEDLWLEMAELDEMKITSILLEFARALHIGVMVSD
jgi:hypothetical protein